MCSSLTLGAILQPASMIIQSNLSAVLALIFNKPAGRPIYDILDAADLSRIQMLGHPESEMAE